MDRRILVQQASVVISSSSFCLLVSFSPFPLTVRRARDFDTGREEIMALHVRGYAALDVVVSEERQSKSGRTMKPKNPMFRAASASILFCFGQSVRRSLQLSTLLLGFAVVGPWT